MDMASFARACVDFSHNIRNLRITGNKSSSSSNANSQSADQPQQQQQQQQQQPQQQSSDGAGPKPDGQSNIPGSPLLSRSGNGTGSGSGGGGAGGATVAAIKQRLFNQGLKIDLTPRRRRTRYRDYMRAKLATKGPPIPASELLNAAWFVRLIVRYLSPYEASRLCSVCSVWRDILYAMPFWRELRLSLPIRQLKEDVPLLSRCCDSIAQRCIDSVKLMNFSDDCLSTFLIQIASVEKRVSELSLHNCTVTDKGLETLVDSFSNLTSLCLVGCNDLSEVCLWSSLSPKLTNLTVTDCINVSDESVSAITQLLPNLTCLELQGYHVTDNAMTLFSSKQATSIARLTLNSCWELTNQGVLNLASSMPHLQELSLSGCSKITDDAVDCITEHMKQLRSLDLSWCQKLTDVSLECIACDLGLLERLQLDRCTTISDIGVGYLSTMPRLRVLCLRWCSSLSDTSLRHILNIRTLSFLSIAGVSRMTGDGLCNLIRLQQLHNLEVTNCPAASCQVRGFLSVNMPNCRVIH